MVVNLDDTDKVAQVVLAFFFFFFLVVFYDFETTPKFLSPFKRKLPRRYKKKSFVD